ncbi:hypothetical protein [Azonexus hydrophilus]|uniref:Uncharacterized protein n=1 Tax=Azonexus hydrophilus TaxID=418702 RepID=A0ABZ2XD79_9RHOO
MERVFVLEAALPDLAWLDVGKLEKMWRRDSLYLPGPVAIERGAWFDFDDNGRPLFMPALGHIEFGRGFFGSPALVISGGRHRTRWLIERGVKEIPISFDFSRRDTLSALSKGLIRRHENRNAFDIDCAPIRPG